MSANESTLHLNFLKNSASLLSSRSSSTAAYLMNTHNRLLYEEFKSLKPRQHETSCAACGSPRNPDHTTVIRVKQRRSNRSGQTSRDGGATVYKCLRCHKRWVRPLQSRNPLQTKSISITNPIPFNSSTSPAMSSPAPPSQAALDAPAATGVSDPKATSENASSKKRAKARKQGGLQALLASKQRSQTSATGSSLDLLDFLQ
jgi:hypothetical protein